MTRLRNKISASLCLLLIFQSAIAQQKPDEQAIKLKSELVELRAVVTDKKGQVIDNLTKDDFEILENDKPQTVSFFSIERTRSARAVSDKKSGVEAPRAASAQPARTMVLFVDTLHLNPLNLIRVKRVLRQFVDEQITDDDVVAIVVTSGTLGALQQFMKDRKMLRYAIDKITPFSRGSSLFTPFLAAQVTNDDDQATQVAIQILAAEEGYIPLTQESAREYARTRARQIIAQETYFRKAALITLKAVCDRLADMPGQRMIAMLSDGFTVMEEGGGADNDSVRAVTGRASRSGVVIYTLDAKGLEVSPEFRASTPGGLAGSLSFSSYMARSGMDQQQILRTLAAETGGEAFLNRNDLDLPLQKVLDNNSVYYALAYYPTDESDRKKFRNVNVRVRNHPEYKVRAQKGYLPAEEKKTLADLTPRQKLIETMHAPLPVTAIAVDASASYFESSADTSQVSLQVHFDGRALHYKQQGDERALNCEVVGIVYDGAGKSAGNFSDMIRATLTPAQMEQGKQNGYRYDKRMTLRPGLYQIRVGVRDTEGELSGTAFCWVEVPDLSKGKVAMSSIFLGKEGSKDASGPRIIAGRASFRSGEMAHYRFVAYNTAAEGSVMKVEILKGEESVYHRDWQPLASRMIRRDQKGAEAGGQLALGLDAGIYELRVTIRDGKSKKTAQQVVSFEVEQGGM
ncbi:MAG: VWA domain-containing protein [Acidobacteriota bacterium]